MRPPTVAPGTFAAVLALVTALAPGSTRAASPGQPAADRGAELFRAGDFDGARTAFREAVRLDPRHGDAWQGLGWAEYRLGNEAKAIRIWSDLLLVEPNRQDTLEAIAMVEHERKRKGSPPPRAAPRQAAPEHEDAAARSERTAAERERREAERDRVAAERERIAAERDRTGAERERQRAATERGDAAYREGDYAGAEREYRDALASGPRHARLLAKLGAAVRKGGRVAEAIEIWNEASRADGAPPQMFRDLGDAYLELGNKERARASYRRAVEATPHGHPGALLQLAELAIGVGDVAEAERSLAALFAVPELDGIWAARAADLFLKHGIHERGVAFFDGAAVPDKVPGKTRALSRLLMRQATLAYRARRFEEAATAFNRVLTFEPDNRSALRDLGWAYRKIGRLDDALKIWTRYARAFSGLAEPHNLLVDLHLERRAHAEAVAESRASLAIDPTQRVAIVRAVRSLFGAGQIREARTMAAGLAARFPGDPQAQHLLGHALTMSAAYRDAARQWRRVLELDPESRLAKQNWIRSLYEAGAADEAIREARKIAASPDAPTPVLELIAQDAIARQDFEDAAGWFRELTRRAPQQVSYWRSLAMMLDSLGRYKEEVGVAREMLRRMPDRGDLQLDLANALRNAGRHDEALRLARSVVREFPDNRAAYETLVSMLSERGKLDEAMREVSRSPFYREYERRMLEAGFRARKNDARSAIRLLQPIASQSGGERFVPILVYHGIVESPRSLQVSAAAFEDQMAALAAQGYQAITLTELARMIDGNVPFPERPILVTFDDARMDSFAYADPILERYGFRATMFVPTGRIRAEDGFHASWGTIARYARTGRWDMQAHGHDAHDPIPVDAAGRTGEFLTYRAWLRGEGRAETAAEYLKRLDDDYRRCKVLMQQQFPGNPILGYAYPLNQIGQARASENEGPPINEIIASRYFRFGLTQDRNGYNGFRAGEKAPFFLRRFEVPREWSGRQLLSHLANRDPPRVARLEIARLTLTQGRPAAARRAIERIVREEPLVAPEAEKTLAQIAWDENRPRSAAAHLAATPRSESSALTSVDTLATRVAWRNSPRLGFDGSLFADSDRRSFANFGGTFSFPLLRELDVDFYGGQFQMTEPGMRALTGYETSAHAATALGRHLDVSGWARYREIRALPRWSVNGGASARLRMEQHGLGVRWANEDVDTVPAQTFSITRQVAAATYNYGSPHWRAEVEYVRYIYEDGNLRNDVHVTLLRRLGASGGWAVGSSFGYEDSRFDPAEYYAPRELMQGMGRLSYRHNWRGGSSVAVDTGVGAARDPVSDLRPSGFGRVRLSRWWGGRIGTTVEVQARALPGYQSLDSTLRLDARF